MNAFLERREASVVRFSPAEFAARINPTDADLQAYYQANLGRYQAPETATVEYLSLDLDSVKKSVNVSEQDLRTYYDENAATLGVPEERRATHDGPRGRRRERLGDARGLDRRDGDHGRGWGDGLRGIVDHHPREGRHRRRDAHADEDRRRELARIALKAEALGLPHHCIVNNNAEGCAPRTIAALAQTVAETRARATAS